MSDEPLRVGQQCQARMGTDRRTLGLMNPVIGGQARSLAGQCQIDGIGHGQGPGMMQVQIWKIRRLARRIRQAGVRVLTGVLRNRQRSLNHLTQRIFRPVCGTGRAAALAAIRGQAEIPVALKLHRLHVAAAHGDREANADRHGRRGAGRTRLRGLLQQTAQAGRQRIRCRQGLIDGLRR